MIVSALALLRVFNLILSTISVFYSLENKLRIHFKSSHLYYSLSFIPILHSYNKTISTMSLVFLSATLIHDVILAISSNPQLHSLSLSLSLDRVTPPTLSQLIVNHCRNIVLFLLRRLLLLTHNEPSHSHSIVAGGFELIS